MPDKADDDNVVYLDRKPGFYKKGPGEFKLHFGTWDEMSEKAREESEVEPDKPDDDTA